MGRLLTALAAALIVPAAAHLGLTAALGAHPWWAVQIAWIGLLPGLAAAYLLPRRLVVPAGFATLALVSLWVAHTGKTRFAASFAEDSVAGLMWYYGWIGTALFAAACLAAVVLLLTGPRRAG